MRSILDGFISKESQKSLASLSRKAKGELSKIPIISVIGDATQGASGLAELKESIENNPNNPRNWLYYYEANVMYKKINGGATVGRALINPIGFIVGKSVSVGLNTLDDQYESFDPKECLGMTIALVMKKIRRDDKKVNQEELVVLAKALSYSSVYTTNSNKKELLNKAIKYISIAIDMEVKKTLKGEYFFYLAEFYNQAGEEKMRRKSLNISRKLGFLPADKLLKYLIKAELSDEEQKAKIDNCMSKGLYKEFSFTYNPSIEDRVANTWGHIKEEQSKKLSETGKRIGGFLDKHFN